MRQEEQRPSVFLSYAREDDEPFVESLHGRLVDAGVDVWWDRKSMASRGRTFLQELRDAIDAVDRVIAVLGPEAMRSEYVLAEWRHAFLFGTPIVPVLRAGEFTDAPVDVAAVHGVDMRPGKDSPQRLHSLVELVQAPVAPLAPFVTPVPALPACFHPRDDLLAAVHRQLLSDLVGPEVVGPAEQLLVLDGMGGTGKSVLASAFCRLAQTRRAVPEGIVWIEVGPNSPPLEVASRLAVALGAGGSELTDLASIRSRLPQLLATRRCLVVLDDVWDVRVVTPILNSLAPQTRLLITTRLADLLAGRQRMHVGGFDPSVSLHLLAEWSGEPLDALPREAGAIVQRCDGLPYALALCSAMRRDDVISWADLEQALSEADLGYFEHRFPNYEHYSDLLSCFQVSVQMLDDTMSKAFLELVVLVDAANIPEAAVLTLWTRNGEPERAARKRLGILAAKALLRIEAGPSARRVVLHALIADFLRASVNDDVQQALHAEMLDAYARRCRDGWASGPDDTYFHHNLCRHLFASKQEDALRAVLGSYAWLAARLAATDALGLVGDYRYLEPDDELHEVEEALRLSLTGLGVDPSQLAGQLLGRLRGSKLPSARALYEEGRRTEVRGWLEPLIAPLRRPGDPLIHSFDLHATSVYAAAISPDGLRAVTGDEQGTIMLWDLDLGFGVRSLRARDVRVWDLALQADGARAIAAYGEQGLYVARLGDGVWEHRLHIEGADFRCVACTPDGTLVVAGVASGLVVWDVRDGRYALIAREQETGTSKVTMAPGGTRAATATADGSIEIWNLEELSMLRRIAASEQVLRSVCFTAHGDQVLTLGDDYLARLWDVATGEQLNSWRTDAYVLGTSPHAAATWIYAGGITGALETHVLARPGASTSVSAHRSPVRAVVTDADATRVLTTADDGEVRVWDAQRLVIASRRDNHPGSVVDVELRPNGSLLASAATDGTVRLWNPARPATPRVYSAHDTSAVRAVAFCPTDDRAASSDAKGRVALWNVETLETERMLKIHEGSIRGRQTDEGMSIELTFGGGMYLCFAEDGSRLLAGGGDGTFARIELDREDEGFRFKLGEGGPWIHSSSRHGKWAVSVADKGAPTTFEVDTGNGASLKGGEDSFVTALRQSDDGRYVFCAYANGAVRGWDLTSGPEPYLRSEATGAGDAAMYDVHTGRRRILGGKRSYYYSSIALTADARFAVFALNAGLLLIRELPSWKVVASFACDDELFSCATSADGELVAAGGQDTVFLFRLHRAEGVR